MTNLLCREYRKTNHMASNPGKSAQIKEKAASIRPNNNLKHTYKRNFLTLFECSANYVLDSIKKE